MTLTPGTPISVSYTKYDGSPHWEFPMEFLARDEHGSWLGARIGTTLSRPGRSFVSGIDFVCLVPDDRGFVAAFNDRSANQDTRTYVDITTVPVWSGTTVTCVDLDLDVVEKFDGRIYLDDEDEFAEHQVTLAYPPELIAAALAESDRVMREVTQGHDPYGQCGHGYLARYQQS